MKESEFSCRVANKDDIVSITDLMMISIEINMQEFLSPEQIEANKESMGVDLTLIEDGSYFVVEASEGEPKPLVGCGGWSKRRTLFGGKHTLSLIHISEPTRRTPISYAVFCLK